MAQIPLAWKNLSHDKVRFGLFVLGISFAVVLMFVQLGFRNALLDSNTMIHDQLAADLVMISPNRQAMAMKEGFPARRLVQVRSVPGVDQVDSIYLDNALGILRDANPDINQRGPSRAIRVLALEPGSPVLKFPQLLPTTQNPNSLVDRLRVPGTALFDRRSKNNPDKPGESIFGPIQVGTQTELTGKKIEFVGSFDLGSDFTTDGTIIVSKQTYFDILRRPFSLESPEAEVDIGLIKVAPGYKPQEVRDAIRYTLATDAQDPDVEIHTLDDLKTKEAQFWLNNTPIGYAFGFGLMMGFAVGLVICYQILSGDVNDHLAEYATLKAIGYNNRYLALVVIQEALILACTGFLVGGIISFLAYQFLGEATGLPMLLTATRILSIFLATLVMCVLSGLIALVGLVRADPADVF